MDEEKVNAFVEEQSRDVLTPPQNASIRRENGAFVITEAVEGRTVDRRATAAALNASLADGQEGAVVTEAVITKKQPDITSEDLASIQDVLGTCTTDFPAAGRPALPMFR